MQNRRLLYIPTLKSGLNLALNLEIVDQYLLNSKYLEYTSNKISLYVLGSTDNIMIGREVVGREEEVYFHDKLKVRDFAESEISNKEIQANSLEEVFSKSDQLCEGAGYRIQFELSSPSKFCVSFF